MRKITISSTGSCAWQSEPRLSRKRLLAMGYRILPSLQSKSIQTVRRMRSSPCKKPNRQPSVLILDLAKRDGWRERGFFHRCYCGPIAAYWRGRHRGHRWYDIELLSIIPQGAKLRSDMRFSSIRPGRGSVPTPCLLFQKKVALWWLQSPGWRCRLVGAHFCHWAWGGLLRIDLVPHPQKHKQACSVTINIMIMSVTMIFVSN